MKDRFFTDHSLLTVLISLLLIFAALFSFTYIGGHASSVETHAATIASLDEKKDTVMALTASSTLASAIISAIPDDTATPIAERLAELTEYFMVVLCVLYCEKYLVTILGFAVFRIMIPLACALCIVGLFRSGGGVWKKLAIKLAVCGLLMYASVPVSVRTSDMIYATYRSSIDSTLSAAEQITEEAEDLQSGDENLWTVITGAAASFKDSAPKILNRFIEALAVMIVTSCLIPLLVLLFFIWLVRTFTGLELPDRKNRPEKPAELPPAPPLV